MTVELGVTAPPDMLAHESESWQNLIRERCGLHFSPSRLRGLHRCLQERMRLHHIKSYNEYYQYVDKSPDSVKEWQTLLDLLLNNESDFFRHTPSFDALTGHVLPELMQIREQNDPIKFWSAGCSMGQEAYSLALAFLESCPASAPRSQSRLRNEFQTGWRVEVKGSDISRTALSRACLGQYKPHELRVLPEPYRQRYFATIGEGHQMVYQVVPRLREIVEFGYVNLHDPDASTFSPLPFIGGRGEGVDVIFCQNVLIYFMPDDRVEIVQRLCQRLRPGGFLFLGPAEAMGLNVPDMQPVRLDDMLIYRRLK